MKNFIMVFTLVFTFTMLIVSPLFAGIPVPPPPPLAIPVDGGAIVLLIAGAAFASKKIYDRRKKSVQNEM
jgi:hypothetical protein